MPSLFDPLKIGAIDAPNRIVMAPMTRSFSPGGVPTSDVAAYYRRRAEGGVGLIVTDGREALTQATLQPYDLFLFDRMLPGLDGLSLLKSLRAAQVATPAILLTAMGAVDDRVAGLRAGADDYMVKPFHMVVLKARIRVALELKGHRQRERAYLAMLKEQRDRS